ncbi:MAG: patatin protein [Holophagaceae bacterium]|nr:patatin protein [Holophagaceae bacterium]
MKVSLRRLLLVIAGLTVLSGAIQLLAPALVLRLVGGPGGAEPRFLFAILGMFMVLFGGLALQALRASATLQALPIRWAALQKLGAAGAVGLGVAKGVFGPVASLVAAFDLLTGILFLVHLRRLSRGRR